MRLIRFLDHHIRPKRHAYLVGMLVTGVLVYVLSAFYQVYKPLPQGLAYQSPIIANQVTFISDQTFMVSDQQLYREQQIFDQLITMIQQARTTIVVDMFLFNQEIGQSTRIHQPLAQRLTHALLAKKREHPEMTIIVLTDPINTLYGAIWPEHLHQLRQHGIDVIITDLNPLRASNPLWSGLWFMCCQALGNSTEKGWLPSPFGTQKITMRSYLTLFNFKANHRKILITDSDHGWHTLVSSANPHDGSDQHSNVAMRIDGNFAQYALHSEAAVARFSGSDVPSLVIGSENRDTGLPHVQLLTEGAIKQHIQQTIDGLSKGDRLDLLLFYLSERSTIERIKAAHLRGVAVRVLLDPNKDAFGRQKNGIPNRPVASELHRFGIPVRWCQTHGEQCHAKMLIAHKVNQTTTVILGSANYTARNLNNYNLETNVAVTGLNTYPALMQAGQYFDRAWFNPSPYLISTDYATYADESRWSYWRYRWMEWSGLSTF